VSSPNSKLLILEAALALIAKRGGADVTIAEIAKAAKVSRQAVYLHFADRADLLVNLARYTDEKCGIEQEIRKIKQAPAGVAQLRSMASLQARTNPAIWASARAFDAVRRTDKAADRSWRERLQNRLEGCRAIVARLQKEGTLRPGLDPAAAADLLWNITSLRTWEDLVLDRKWSARQYEDRVTELLLLALTKPSRRAV
jgi:AcrR family transcriptional regulator